MADNKQPGAIEAIGGAPKPVQAAPAQPQGQIQVPTAAGEPQQEAPAQPPPEQARITDEEFLELSPKAQEAMLAAPESREGEAADGGEADKGANLPPQTRARLQKILEDQKAQEAQPGEKTEEIAGEEGNTAGAQQAGGAGAAGEKKTVEEVKVSWQPLMQVGQVVNAGEPFGHFQISREKKEVDDKKGPAEGAAPAQGAHGAHGAHGKKDGDNMAPGAVKGADGKTPVVNKGQNPDEEKKQSKGVETGEGGKMYVIDSVSGERMEIPENGELQATHPMKIKSIGTVGELKNGDELFSYETAKPDEIENSKKAKEKGITPEELQKTKEKGPGVEEQQKARDGAEQDK